MKIKQIAPSDKKKLYRILFSDDCSEVLESILGDLGDSYCQAFTYFFRRFGASMSSSDSDKELVRYTLQTHKKGWFLNVGFTSFGHISFTLYTDNMSIFEANWKEGWQVSKKYCEERDVWLAANGMTYYETIVDVNINPEDYHKLNNAFQVWQKENGYGTGEKEIPEDLSKMFYRYIYAENKRVSGICPIECRDESEFQFPIRDEAIEIMTEMAKDFLIPTYIRDTALNFLGKFEYRKKMKIRKSYEPFKHSGESYSVNISEQ